MNIKTKQILGFISSWALMILAGLNNHYWGNIDAFGLGFLIMSGIIGVIWSLCANYE